MSIAGEISCPSLRLSLSSCAAANEKTDSRTTSTSDEDDDNVFIMGSTRTNNLAQSDGSPIQNSASNHASRTIVGITPLPAPNKQSQQQHQQHQHQQQQLNQTQAISTQQPIALPNNTLVEDLSKCHANVTDLWPRATQATLTTLNAFRACWAPTLLRKQSRPAKPSAGADRSSRDDHTCRLATDEPAQTQAHKHTARKCNHKPLKFRMPHSIERLHTKLNQQDYDKALSTLTNDVRYQLHLILYTRLDTIWTLVSTVLCILIPVLLSNFELPVLASVGALWLVSLALGAVVTNRTKRNLDLMLERSVAQANSFFLDHNLMLGVINVGGLISKTKLMVPMLYFDTSQCREQIESIIGADAQKHSGNSDTDKRALDYSKIGLPLTEPNMVALAQSQLAKKVVLRHIQRWISYFDKRKLMFTDDRIKARHLSTGKCLCQFIEEHFKNSSSPQLTDEDHQENYKIMIESDFCDTPKTTTNNINSMDGITHLLNANTKQQQHQPKTLVNANTNIETIQADTLLSNNQQSKPINGIIVSTLTSGMQQEPTVSYIRNNLYNNTSSVPTLSGLISAKDGLYNNVTLDTATTATNTSPVAASNVDNRINQYPSTATTTTTTCPSPTTFHKQDEHLDDNGNNIMNRNSLNLGAGVSLEMDTDYIGRSDDLIKKLRLLLELRKDDLLRGIGGSSLFANAQQQHLFYPPDDGCSSMGNNTLGAHTTIEIAEDSGSETTTTTTTNMKTKNLKKFFSQGEGSSFFGLNGFKKNHQKETNMNQALEIC